MDLGEGLRKALAKLTGSAIMDEKAVKEFVKELQRTLISNDVNVKLVFDLSRRVEERVLKEKPLPGVSPKEHAVRAVYDELVALMGDRYEPKIEPKRILLLGLFGSGKTTTTTKLAKFFQQRGMKAGVVCCDTFRPAAFEQLKQLSEKSGIHFYGEKGETDAAKVVRNGLFALKGEEVVIVDSSGRSAFDSELKGELHAIHAALGPSENFLVISADIGQAAGRQAKEFNENVPLTGVIITKMDGSGKGGGALSAVASTGAKVAFIGTGERAEDLEPFDSKKYVGRLLGFPDIDALLSKIKKVAEEENLNPEAMLEEKFTLKTFYEQMRATKKMGPLKNVFGMMGMADVPKEMLDQGEEKLKKFEVMINSMTPAEREDAHLIKKSSSRQARIAKGAGVKVEDVRRLISEFERMEKMMGAFKKNRGFRKQIEKMMKGGGGLKLPGA
jgi:signal recognition particle subunit SRP54